MENQWTNPGFLETQISAKSQGLKTSESFFTMFFAILKICIMFRYWIFDAVPDRIVPELISWRSAENIDLFFDSDPILRK